MANKTYKFRLYPTKEQEELLAKTFGCVRFVYNKMLEERLQIYEKFKDDKEAMKKQSFPTPAKYKKEFAWLKEVDSLALANAQLNLKQAFTNFFEGRTRFPKFKSLKAKQSYTTNMVNNNIKLADGSIKLPKLNWVKLSIARVREPIILDFIGKHWKNWPKRNGCCHAAGKVPTVGINSV